MSLHDINVPKYGKKTTRSKHIQLLAAEISAIIARAFSRILFRNSWNHGVPAIEVDPVLFMENEIVELDLTAGTINTEKGVNLSLFLLLLNFCMEC